MTTLILWVLLRESALSGRALAIRDAHEIRIAPGPPPLVAFRMLEGRKRGRFSGIDLVLDDAGH